MSEMEMSAREIRCHRYPRRGYSKRQSSRTSAVTERLKDLRVASSVGQSSRIRVRVISNTDTPHFTTATPIPEDLTRPDALAPA